MSVTVTPIGRTLHRAEAAVRGRLPVAWIVGGVLALYALLIQLITARTTPLARGDEGLLLTTVTYTVHGVIPITDYYEPYGIGWGIPGAIAHVFGFTSVMDIRVTYALIPPLVTLLATVFVWRRTDWRLGLLVGLVSLASVTSRYSMGWAPLFAFLLLVDHMSRRTPTGSLREIATSRPVALAAAGALLSVAGWARVEYQWYGIFWAALLFLVLRGRPRIWQTLSAGFFAVLPTLIVIATGGLQHLLWILRYLTSSSIESYGVQRGRSVDWSFVPQRISELFHLKFDSPANGLFLGSLGLAVVVVVAGVIVYAVPSTRRRMLRDDPALLTVFMLPVCALTTYGLASSFLPGYSAFGAFLVWATGAMLLRRTPRMLLKPIPAAATLVVVAALAYPYLGPVTPNALLDQWNGRAPTPAYGYAPGLKGIVVAPDNGGPSMASLVALWHQLGLDGRSTLAISRRNDVFWSTDMIEGYLLNAPPAAWPVTYDPGLINRDDVEKQTVQTLCHNRDPLVQFDSTYGYLNGVPIYYGSRRLDEFLAVDYGVRAVAGLYRILLPSTPSCVLPQTLSDARIESLRNQWIDRGEMPEAGALAILLLDREQAQGRPADPVNASIAALGGYHLTDAELPPDPLRQSLLTLTDDLPRPDLAVAATLRWPNDFEALAAQSAWAANRPITGNFGSEAAAILALARRHPNWPQAIGNVTGIVPGNSAVFRALSGAAGQPVFDQWRLNYYMATHDFQQSLSVGMALIADYQRADDPLDAAHAELAVSSLPGLDPGCSRLLRRRAAEKSGIGLPPQPAAQVSCDQPQIEQATL